MRRWWAGLLMDVLMVWAQGVAAESPGTGPAATAEVPKGAVTAPGAWCESFAHKDLYTFLQQLAAAYGRGEVIVWVRESEDLEHPHRYIGCKRTPA